MKNQERCVQVLAALANDYRLTAFTMLVHAGGDGVTAGDIARGLGLTPSALSFHMAQLELAGLIRMRRAGRNNYYMANDDVGRAALLQVLAAWDVGDPVEDGATAPASSDPTAAVGG